MTAPETPPDNGVTLTSNPHAGLARLTVCIPAYRDDASALIRALSRQPGAEACALLIYDDGTCDAALTTRHVHALHAFPGPAGLITAATNLGRSRARNRLVAAAQTDWIVLLDADMLPDTDDFLTTYLAAVSARPAPALIAGGFTLHQAVPGPHQQLHYAQAAASDCLPAAERARAPGRFVFTSNILVHADVLRAVAFDEGFRGWGWEDVDWGLRVAAAFPVRHIDNTATHLGLEPDDVLIRKFGSSGANFARLVEKHPDAAAGMALWRAARRVRGMPLIEGLARAFARQTFWPLPLRLLGLKLYRAAAYARHL
jgi:glycosyltransferase involved in cell wall biosynthesis